MFASFAVAAVFIAIGSFHGALQATDAARATQEFDRLERTWNEAHTRGDVPALDRLCAEALIVTGV